LHDQLVVAAELAITRGGLQTLRARQLAEAVGCSVGAIYGVFPDLDALILTVNARTLAAIDIVMSQVPTAQGPVAHLVQMSLGYLGYAAGNRALWAALFQHRVPEGQAIPSWYTDRQIAAFSHVEAPLAALLPDLPENQRALLARSLFSAVHGMVALGLDEKVAAMPMPVLRAQIQQVVEAICRGLAAA
jgi:AcrR family transcriptional regulator